MGPVATFTAELSNQPVASAPQPLLIRGTAGGVVSELIPGTVVLYGAKLPFFKIPYDQAPSGPMFVAVLPTVLQSSDKSQRFVGVRSAPVATVMSKPKKPAKLSPW